MRGLVLHTVPSQFMVAGESTGSPYQRVVGVETAAGIIACRFALSDKPQMLHFSEVPDEAALLVAKFFDQHLADTDPEQTTTGYAGRMRYNCHVFAVAMQGENITNPRLLDKRIAELAARSAPFAGHLAAGQHGIVHNPEIEDVSHSFVGLGETTPFTLQVMNNNANMGVLPYEQTLVEFSRHQGGAYVLAA